MTNVVREFWTFFKYAMVGAAGTAVHIGIYMACTRIFLLPEILANGMGFIFAVVNNFILNKFWTFQNKSTNIRKQFIKFFIIALIGLVLSTAFFSVFFYIFHIWDILAILLTSGVVMVWNFLGNKLWTFRDKLRSIRHREAYPFELSVIVPAYNESKRISSTLSHIHEYLQKSSLTFEIIVVDDGSKDHTTQVVEEIAKTMPELQVIHYMLNQGKGYAVKRGVEASQGRFILFTDADNSTPIQEFDKVFPLLKTHEVVIGSRYLADSNVVVKQPRYRIILGRLGNFLIRSFLIDGIKDTQCGFKTFQHGAAQEIFARMKIKRFGFDMELLAIAKLLQYSIQEVPVNWYNSPDSRVRPIKDAFHTLRELIAIKLNLWGGRYH